MVSLDHRPTTFFPKEDLHNEHLLKLFDFYYWFCVFQREKLVKKIMSVTLLIPEAFYQIVY